jgi:hypothetical protein
MGLKIPLIIAAVGSKREKVKSKLDFSRGEKVIVQEIEELKGYLDKNLAEQRPLAASFLMEHLEVIHQLSYPELNKRFYKMLWLQGQLFEIDSSWMNRLLGPFQFLNEQMAKFATKYFMKEASIYIGQLLLLFLFLWDRNEKKKDFTFFLKLTLLTASKFLKKMAQELMQGLIIEEKAAAWVSQTVLGVSAAMLFVWMKFKKLHEKESEELFLTFKPLFDSTLENSLSFFENKEGSEFIQSFALKLKLALEEESSDSFVDEMTRIFTHVLGISPLEIEKTIKGIEELNLTIQENLLASEKEKNKLAYIARSA